MSRPTDYRYVVYLVHFEEPIGNDKHKAQHYAGGADDLYQRMRQHRKGTPKHAARILAVCNERGVQYRVVRTWPAGRYSVGRVELRVKGKKPYDPDNPNKRRPTAGLAKHCPLCNARLRRRLTRFIEPGYEAVYDRIAGSSVRSYRSDSGSVAHCGAIRVLSRTTEPTEAVVR